jgi:hypothetical protein
MWVANSTAGTISAFNSTGTALTGSPYSDGGVSSPQAIALSPR